MRRNLVRPRACRCPFVWSGGDGASTCSITPVPQALLMHRGGRSRAPAGTRLLFSALLALTIIGGAGQSVHAQVVIGTDVTFASRYHWRGLTRTNEWVFQDGLYAALQLANGYLTAEFWNTSELGSADPTDLSDAGLERGGWTEQDWSVQYLFELRDFVLGAGWVKYRFFGDPEASGRGEKSDTHELFGSVEWRRFDAFAPKISVWYDYDEVDGAYIEATGSFRLPWTSLGGETSIYLDVIGGFAFGQGETDGDLTYFEGNGPTHVALAPTLVIGLQPTFERLFHSRSFPRVTALIEPFRVQRNIDQKTRRTSLRDSDQNNELTWRVLSVTLSIATP